MFRGGKCPSGLAVGWESAPGGVWLLADLPLLPWAQCPALGRDPLFLRTAFAPPVGFLHPHPLLTCSCGTEGLGWG